MAADGRPGQPGRLADGRRPSTARSTCIRRGATLDRKREQIARELDDRGAEPDFDAALDDDIGDDLLRLIFTACHPVLSTEARDRADAAAARRADDGRDRARVPRRPRRRVAQRIMRAKRTLAEAGVPFEVPAGDERAERLGSVLEVVYLIFNEGYSATAGDDWMRPELCEDALRLGRILAELLPGRGARCTGWSR